MTRDELIAQIKAENPTLTYGINEEVFEMTAEQYEETIVSWADARLVKQQAEAQAKAKREAALSKLADLGLTADDLRALGLQRIILGDCEAVVL